VWVDNHREPPYALISVRGSAKAKDFLVDDAGILLTGKSRNLIQTDLKRAVDKYADAGTVEVAGHSLGTTLVSEALQGDSTILDKIDRVDFFNPATSPLTKAVVSDFSDESKAHFYENQGDLVGLGQMLYSSAPKNVTMLPIQSMNPLTNHGIEQWMGKTEIKTGQLDDSAKRNLDDHGAGWKTE